MTDSSELPRDVAKEVSGLTPTQTTQVNALFRAGIGIEQIAMSLGLDVTTVKTTLVGADKSETGLASEIEFTSVDLALVKARMLQHALNGSEGVSSKMCMFIASQNMVSKESRYRADKRLTEGDKGTVINNIVVGVAEAKRLADLYNPDRAAPQVVNLNVASPDQTPAPLFVREPADHGKPDAI